MLDPAANLEELELRSSIGERLELAIRRHYSNWMRGIMNIIAYGLSIGIPWTIGAIWIVDAIMQKGGL